MKTAKNRAKTCLGSSTSALAWAGLVCFCGLALSLPARAKPSPEKTGTKTNPTSPSTSAKPPAKPAAKPPGKSAEKPLEIPIPINRSAKGVRIPIYTPEGHLQMRMESNIVFRVDQLNLRFTDLKVTTFTDDDQPEMTIDMPESIFHLVTRVFTTEDVPVIIHRGDVEITGSHMTFDTQSQKGKFVGPVRVLVFKTESDPTEKKTEPSAPETPSKEPEKETPEKPTLPPAPSSTP